MSMTYKIEFDNSQIENFGESTSKVYKAVMECGAEIIKEHLEKTDEGIMRKRDRKRYINKGIHRTAVKTKLGTIEYSRQIYFDMDRGKHVYLLDEIIKPQNTGLYDEDEGYSFRF